MKEFNVIHPETGLEVTVVAWDEVQAMNNKLTRLEIINHAKNELPIGRTLTLYKELGDFNSLDFSYQDSERTLKIFLQ